MAELDYIEGWTVKDEGPGVYAVDPHDRVSVWVEGSVLHYETLRGGDECDIPLAVVDKLRELEKAGERG